MTREDRQTDPARLEPLPYQKEELVQRNAELEKFNAALVNERETLKKELNDASRLLQASISGLVFLDKTGLIDSVNPRAAELLGAAPSLLLKKPISLFIAPEDQALFFINRSRIVSGLLKNPFEIKLKRSDGSTLAVRIHAQAVETPGQHLPGMLMAVEDITAYRQAMEAMQLKEYAINLLVSTIDDLSTWSSADIDEIINGVLEKVGLVSGADRVYVCLFHGRNTHFSITHEWLAEGIDSLATTLRGMPVEKFIAVLGKLKNRHTVSIADTEALAPTERMAHDGFHAAGVRSLLFTPLAYGRRLLGVIGCDAVRQVVDWSTETRQLIASIGTAIVHALLRRRIEQAPTSLREAVFPLVDPPPPGSGEDFLEYDGPIEILDEQTQPVAPETEAWRFEKETPDDPDLVGTVLLRDGKTANLACQHCNRQRLLDISEIRTLGTQLKATCICGIPMYVKIELRREHRKAVRLEGVFMRGPGDRLAEKSDDWGRIQIGNLSRRGIGFTVVGKADLRVDDRLRVKFTLDNTASSVIHKAIVVRSVTGDTVGCQFEGQDPCDVTLGFYMMS